MSKEKSISSAAPDSTQGTSTEAKPVDAPANFDAEMMKKVVIDIGKGFGNMKLAIATPFFEVKAYSPYLMSLYPTLEFLAKANVNYCVLERNSDAYVQRAKNMLLAKFMKTDATHIMFIDSDLSWDVQSFANILKAEGDIVAGIFPCKNKWSHYPVGVFRDGTGKMIKDEKTGLLRAFMIPGGFVKYSRNCIERMFKAYEIERYDDEGYECRNLFEQKIISRIFHGEDVVFCKKWMAIGGKIWVEPKCTFTHWGVTGYTGNYQTFLNEEAEKEKKAIEEKQKELAKKEEPVHVS